jgi:DNA-binding beta-propeller fold protein YncE
MAGGYAGTPMAGSYTGTPVVIRSGGGNRLAGCIIALVVLSVVGSLAIGLLASVGGLLPLLAIPGLTDILPDDVQEVVADVTNQYPRVELRFGGTGTGSGVFTDARHVGVDGDGNIYVAEYTGGRVQVFGPDGRYVTQWTPESENDIYLTGFAVGHAGDVYLVYGSDLFQFDGQTGDLIQQLEYPDDWGFSDVAALPGGGVAATWYKNRDDLIVYDEDGEVAFAVQEAISGITGDLEPTVNVAVDGRGDIFLAGSFAEAIFHYSADGEYQNRFGGAGDEAGQFRAIGDLAIDQQGRIYVSDIRGIQVFDNDGRFVETIDPPEVSYVYGMAFDTLNRLYVVSNDTVFKFQLAADE